MTEPTRRQRRRTLSDKGVADLKRKKKRYILADPELRGHYIRVPAQGPCVFTAVARYKGKQVWATLGTADVLGIDEARDKAREAIKRIQQGLPAFEPPPPPPVQPDSFAAVAENWLKRHVEAKSLRTGSEIKRLLEKHALPVWRERVFKDIRRSDIALLLDTVEDERGTWVADSVLSVLRAMASWYATRDDTFVPPFVKNMRRTPPQDRKRSRILSDDELRQVWNTCEADDDVYAAFVRVSLLTGQRYAKTVAMRWDDISKDGTWSIPSQPREKGNPGNLALPPIALDIIRKQPRLAGNPYVFAGRRAGRPFNGVSWSHERLKARAKVQGFTVHDLRRTARSLMARAGVPSEHAERVLGHVIPEVAGIYDRHPYQNEMADALKRLARLIESIVHGEPGKNVVTLRPAALQP